MLLNTELTLKRRLLTFTWESTYTLQGEISVDKRSDVLDLLVRSVLLPALSLNEGTIFDIKGRDRSPGEELFFAEGRVLTGEKHQRFEVHITSNFHSFLEPGHIRHTVDTRWAGDVGVPFPVKWIGRVFPVEISKYRIGIELFESKRFSSLLGFAPVVTQTLYVDCDNGNVTISLWAENLKSKAELPLRRFELWQRLEGVLQSILDFDLRADYLRRI